MAGGGGDADAFVRAAGRGDLGVVQEAVERHPQLLNAINRQGWSALQMASYKGRLPVAQLLLDRGAAIDQPSQSGCTPLIGAALNGHLAMAQLLTRRGASLEVRTNSNHNAQWWAAHEGHAELASWLGRARGWTALHFACAEREAEEVLRLLRQGELDIHTRSTAAADDGGPASALQVAASRGPGLAAVCDRTLQTMRLAHAAWAPRRESHRVWPDSFRRSAVALMLVKQRADRLAGGRVVEARVEQLSRMDVALFFRVLSFCGRDWWRGGGGGGGP